MAVKPDPLTAITLQGGTDPEIALRLIWCHFALEFHLALGTADHDFDVPGVEVETHVDRHQSDEDDVRCIGVCERVRANLNVPMVDVNRLVARASRLKRRFRKAAGYRRRGLVDRNQAQARAGAHVVQSKEDIAHSRLRRFYRVNHDVIGDSALVVDERSFAVETVSWGPVQVRVGEHQRRRT